MFVVLAGRKFDKGVYRIACSGSAIGRWRQRRMGQCESRVEVLVIRNKRRGSTDSKALSEM